MSISDGIIACWDAGGKRSYPGTGTTWYDVVGGQNGTLVNGSDGSLTFNYAHGGYIEDFDGSDDYITMSTKLFMPVKQNELPITIDELTRIKGKVDGTTGLLPVLRGIYHIRIEYPEDKNIDNIKSAQF